MTITCGEATMRLLARYGVTTVFGIPGVHTLDMCRGLHDGAGNGLRHVRARNEQGAGFMAEGWARATGEPGVALVISGPGVTNAATALGQSYADSLPLLLLSAEPETASMGKGWGVLHEITEQKSVTAPITALSATAMRAADVPELLARAFTLFASERPRPVHISLPIDVQAEPVTEDWQPVMPPARPMAGADQIAAALTILRKATRPALIIGGGAAEAGDALTRIAERLGAIVVSTSAGKGIVADAHPLHLSGGLARAPVRDFLAGADVILAIGTELAETDSFVGYRDLTFTGSMIRVDIDPRKLTDLFPANPGIVGDATPVAAALAAGLEAHDGIGRRQIAEQEAATLRTAMTADLGPSEIRHRTVLDLLRRTVPPETVFCGDVCQIVYSGGFMMQVPGPRQWFYPAGFCALGNGLPNAVGAKLARPEAPVVVLVGDGGFMFTMPELMTAVELLLPIPVIIWDNGSLKQIRDDMDMHKIPRVGVEGANPDFMALARACGCAAVHADGEEALCRAVTTALAGDGPTVILVREDDPWLRQAPGA